MADEFVFRIATQLEWEAAQKAGGYVGGDLDSSSGFIHFSTLEQVPGTLKLFYPGQSNLVLLKVSAEKLGAGLKYDEVPTMGTFPHFYNIEGQGIKPVSLDAIVDARTIELTDGVHVVPFLDKLQ